MYGLFEGWYDELCRSIRLMSEQNSPEKIHIVPTPGNLEKAEGKREKDG